jgi:hypothetical protein
MGASWWFESIPATQTDLAAQCEPLNSSRCTAMSESEGNDARCRSGALSLARVQAINDGPLAPVVRQGQWRSDACCGGSWSRKIPNVCRTVAFYVIITFLPYAAIPQYNLLCINHWSCASIITPTKILACLASVCICTSRTSLDN